MFHVPLNPYFYPNLPIFLHGYIRHIRDISQLCANAQPTNSTDALLCMLIFKKLAVTQALRVKSKNISYLASQDHQRASIQQFHLLASVPMQNVKFHWDGPGNVENYYFLAN